MAELLRAENISKHYAGVSALKNATVSIAAGEVHALMGENGAGKSTLSKILAGATMPDEGRIFIDGQEVSIRNPIEAQAKGIGIIYQELDLFPSLTVAENIVIGNLNALARPFVSFRQIHDFCRPFLDRVGFRGRANDLVASLPMGQLQLVALARALSMKARLILMDEPTSSLTEDGAERLFALISDLKQSGVSIVYVSHKMDEIFRICDRVTVLRDGEVIATENVADTSRNALIRMMVGRELEQFTRTDRPGSGEILLSVSHLTTAKLHDVSFDLKCGEVLGVAGLVGAGRSELGAALFGLHARKAGKIHLRGAAVDPRSPEAAIAHGIGLVPEDRKLQGLMMQMSVLENSTLAKLKSFERSGFLSKKREADALRPLYGQLALKSASWSAAVSTLSGGNQQKTLLARWLLIDPDVLFLDDPARGIDVGAKQDIYRIIDALARSGKGIILVSSELPELLRCCDRILVLNEGRLTAQFDASEATQEKIMAAATMRVGSHTAA